MLFIKNYSDVKMLHNVISKQNFLISEMLLKEKGTLDIATYFLFETSPKEFPIGEDLTMLFTSYSSVPNFL